MTEWTHDTLAADLMDARHRVGEIAMERVSLAGVLDVVSMRLSWSKPMPTGYEIKISRADFLSDIRSEKWRKYREYVRKLYYAVPKGLVAANEVPIECGLMYRGPNGWYTVRAPIMVLTPPAHALQSVAMALLFRHYPTTWDGAHRTRENVQAALARG